MLVRLHPFIRARTPIGPELDGFAIDVSDHPDINELMLVSDVLVTDYSSAIYEFSLLGRPMVFFAPDYEAYEARARLLLRLPHRACPGPIFETTEALAPVPSSGDFDLERVESLPGGARSTSPTDGPQRARHGRAASCRHWPGREIDRQASGTTLRGLGVPYRGPSIPGASRPCDRNRSTTMTFRAKPVVKRDHRPAWETQDRRNFYLNLGFGLIVVLAVVDPRPSPPGSPTTTTISRSVGSVDGQSITEGRVHATASQVETWRLDEADRPDPTAGPRRAA